MSDTHVGAHIRVCVGFCAKLSTLFGCQYFCDNYHNFIWFTTTHKGKVLLHVFKILLSNLNFWFPNITYLKSRCKTLPLFIHIRAKIKTNKNTVRMIKKIWRFWISIDNLIITFENQLILNPSLKYFIQLCSTNIYKFILYSYIKY